MRILIIGGTRFIGPHVVRLLHAQGHDIMVFHRGKSHAVLPRAVRHLHGDRRELHRFSAEFAVFAPEVLLDMVPLYERHALDVLDVFSPLVGRCVAISSQDVYRAYGRLLGTETGSPSPLPLTEDAPLRDRLFPYRTDSEDDKRAYLYHYDKILVEQALLAQKQVAVTILRLPMVYGPGDYQHRFYPYVRRMADNRPWLVLQEDFARWRWTRGYVADVAHAIALAVTTAHAGRRVFNLGEAPARSTMDYVQQLAGRMDWHGRIITLPVRYMPESLRQAGNFSQHLACDTTLVREQLGFTEPTPPDKALGQTIDWELSRIPVARAELRAAYAAEDAAIRQREKTGG